MGLYGHVALTCERRGVYIVLVEKLRDSDHLEDPGVDGRVNFKIDLQRSGMGGHELG